MYYIYIYIYIASKILFYRIYYFGKQEAVAIIQEEYKRKMVWTRW